MTSPDHDLRIIDKCYTARINFRYLAVIPGYALRDVIDKA
ncbi:hypothetical protein SAMN05216311_104388 [Chitinophaga sp. CF418]|nr:hypothetical protein SAMN05216311_104388 [Chitinophaga sp. CF418]